MVKLIDHALREQHLTPQDLVNEWVAMATGVPVEGLTWGAKAKALETMTERYWPDDQDDTPQQNTTINIYGALSDEELEAKLKELDAAFNAFVETRPEYRALVEGKVHQEEQ